MKSWLKGGLIGLILGIIFSLYMSSLSFCVGLNSDGTSNCPTRFDLFLDNLTAFFPSIVITLISLFIIGAIIGWIIGIIKKNKNDK